MTKLIRIPEGMYLEIAREAKSRGRSIQMQAHILLGAAMNRGLYDPGPARVEITSDGNILLDATRRSAAEESDDQL